MVFNPSSGSRVPERERRVCERVAGSGLRVSVNGRRAARVNMSENGSSSDELDECWQKILEQQAKAQQERRTGQRRSASRRAEEKMLSYKLPEIVVCPGWWWRQKASGLVSKCVCVYMFNPYRAQI